MDKITEAITEHWGERCKDVEPGCPCCDAWAEYDALIGETERCAKIAESWPTDIGAQHYSDDDLTMNETAGMIAAAIRQKDAGE